MKLKAPTPSCCEVVKEKENFGLPFIEFFVDPEDEEYRGWRMQNALSFITFCPFCGTRLPEMKKTLSLEKVTVVNDGGYYCSTCGERLSNCECSPPAAQWTPRA